MLGWTVCLYFSLVGILPQIQVCGSCGLFLCGVSRAQPGQSWGSAWTDHAGLAQGCSWGAGMGILGPFGSFWGVVGAAGRARGPGGRTALDGIVTPALRHAGRCETQISRQLSLFHSSFYVMKLVTYSLQDKFYKVPDSVRAVSSQALSSQLSPQSVIQI